MTDATIHLVDRDDVFLQWASDRLHDGLGPDTPIERHGTLDAGRAAGEAAGAPSVVLFGPNLAAGDVLDAVRTIDATNANVACIFVAAAPEPALLTDALRAGVADVLTYPFDADELVAAARRVVARITPRPPVHPVAAVHDVTSTDAATARPGKGHVVTVFSTKGGSGKSLVATNLAVLLAQAEPDRVVIADLDLQSADVAILLDVQNELGLLEASERLESIDGEALGGYLVRHSSGLHVLTAPNDPSVAEGIGADAVVRVVELLRERFDYVVLDGPAQFTEQILAAFDLTDTFVLMASLDIPSIKNLRVAMNTFDQLGIDRDKVRVCVNRANTKVGLTMKDVRKALGSEIHVAIPSSRDVPVSYNAATPLAVDHPDSEVVVAIAGLLGGLGVDKAEAAPRRRRWWR